MWSLWTEWVKMIAGDRMKHFGVYLCQGENKASWEYGTRTQKQDTDNPGPTEDEEVLR